MAGFGLRGIRERVEILAGRVEIHSRMDSGTTVEVCIPVGAVPDESAGGDVTSARLHDGGNRFMNSCRCLIADDHPIVRRGVRELLEEEQLCSEICEVRTGEEALDAVRRLPWDLMILDIALPDKHGLEVLKEAKLLQPRLPVLMLSLYPEKEFAMRAIKAGASGI